MRTLFFYLSLGLYLLVTIVLSMKYNWLGKKGKLEAQEIYLEKLTTHWGRSMIKACFSKVEVTGLENIPERNVLFVSNHQGYADIPVILGFVPKLKGIVAKIEMKKAPIMSIWMTRMGCLFLDRSSMRQSMQMILNGIEMLKSGKTLVIFPEGTRSKSNHLGEFKKGSLQLAVKSGAPVVPVTISGSYKMFEEKGGIRPATIKVTVHPPIYMDNLSPEEKKNLAEIVKKIIEGPLS